MAPKKHIAVLKEALIKVCTSGSSFWTGYHETYSAVPVGTSLILSRLKAKARLLHANALLV
jgi:hypothetical protein